MASAIGQPLKWHGGKNYLAKHIIALMPKHLHYVEPFFGGGAVLLARDPNDSRLWVPGHKGVSEVVNDIDGILVNFWRVLRRDDSFAAFVRQVQAIPLARAEWEEAHAHRYGSDPVEDAVAFFVNCRQSRAGSGKGFTPLTRKRLRRGMNGNASEWLNAVDDLPEVYVRLRLVVIECVDGIELIKREETPDSFFYCDPPYPHSTRATKDGYRFEMTDADHVRLARVLNEIEGKAMVSSYPSELYDGLYPGWCRLDFEKPNDAAGGPIKAREIEVLLMNYDPDPAVVDELVRGGRFRRVRGCGQ
jgi:DNA adenine methylase